MEGVDFVDCLSYSRYKENTVILAVLFCLRTLMNMQSTCCKQRMSTKVMCMTCVRLFLRPLANSLVSVKATTSAPHW